MAQISKLVIDTKTWARGKRKQITYLLGPDGKQCCLGFLGSACGIFDDKLEGAVAPSCVLSEAKSWPAGLIENVNDYWLRDTPWTDEAVTLNDMDNRKISFAERTKKLRAHFKKFGIKLIFKK